MLFYHGDRQNDFDVSSWVDKKSEADAEQERRMKDVRYGIVSTVFGCLALLLAILGFKVSFLCFLLSLVFVFVGVLFARFARCSGHEGVWYVLGMCLNIGILTCILILFALVTLMIGYGVTLFEALFLA